MSPPIFDSTPAVLFIILSGFVFWLFGYGCGHADWLQERLTRDVNRPDKPDKP